MTLILRLMKFTMVALLLVALFAAAVFLWLRYEFSRVQQTQHPLDAWHQVEVSALDNSPTKVQPTCSRQYPDKRAWFGALHVHTAASYDAAAFGVSTTVDDAYRYARGATLKLRLRGDPDDYEAPDLRISSPLDFMAVTDHAESLGETHLCYQPNSDAYRALSCRLYRGDWRLPMEERMQSLIRLASFAVYGNDRSARVCGVDGDQCREQAAAVWRENQRSTEAFHDYSAECEFTTFHAYEYTLAVDASNLHRNVIFRSSTVPQEALSAKDANTPEALWQWLDAACIAGNPNCDVLAIPHNSNWSSGRMWFPYSNRDLPLEKQQEFAALRAKLEPLAEIMQVKGDSECRNGINSVLGAADEFCNFEKLRPTAENIVDCGEEFDSGGMLLKGCVSRYSYVRYAVTAGLAEEQKLGVNPFKLGIVAASDTHLGAPSAGRERNHLGSHGNDRNVQDRLLSTVDVPGGIATGSPVRYNPGGIAGIYATENTRGALFAAMRRRETFGTSGPRITPRFFAGWNLDENLCEQPDQLATAYAAGVPMGGKLPRAPSGPITSPVFMASAVRDTREGGNLLQRLQIIKGWVDESGNTHQAVYHVAGAEGGNADVDKHTCKVTGSGYQQLCATWQDPHFDPKVAAVYYLRALENPSCRWSQHDCLSLPAAERPASCADPTLPWKIQERAWTSPIWYQPNSGRRPLG